MPHIIADAGVALLFYLEAEQLVLPIVKTNKVTLPAGDSDTTTAIYNAKSLNEEYKYGLKDPILIPVLIRCDNDPLLSTFATKYKFHPPFPANLTVDPTPLFSSMESPPLLFPTLEISTEVTAPSTDAVRLNFIFAADIMELEIWKLFNNLLIGELKDRVDAAIAKYRIGKSK